MDWRPSLLSVKFALSSLEKAIPVFGGLSGEINQNVTRERRSVASRIIPALDGWLDSLPNPDDTRCSPAAVEDGLEERYGCDDDIRDSLNEFNDCLHKLWPSRCEAPHKLMLKLVPHRQYESGGQLAVDTLSSGHDQHWGRIVFTLRKRPPIVTVQESSSRRVKFADESTDDGDDFRGRAHDYTARPHDEANGVFHGSQADCPTLCSLIEKSGKERVCLRVDVESLTSSEPRGEKGIRSSKPTVALRDLLTPLKMVGCDDQTSREACLTPAQKAEVGLVLACSLLQLCRGQWGKGSREGAWLRRDWAEQGICFLPGVRNELDIGSPYLPWLLDSSAEEGGFDYHASSVVALATTLVQLQDDEVIQELDSIFQGLLDDGGMTPTTKYCALLELLNTEIFISYVDEKCQMAIKACLNGEFASSIGLEEEAATETLFRTLVVRPLSEYHHRMQQFTGRRGLAQRIQGTTRGKDKRHQSSRLPETVEAFPPSSQTATSWAYGEADDATGVAPRREIFQIQGAAFQAGQYAKPDDWLHGFKKISEDIAKIPKRCVSQPRGVRVAVLDTGVNLARQFFQSGARCKKIKQTANFVPDSRPVGAAFGAVGHDTFGHGSLMAQLLMEAAPMADVYIARVAENTHTLWESKEAIVKAIEWADDQDVDIISMSFGFADDDQAISTAIESVHTRRRGSVIFVASAGNSPYEREKFPARHRCVMAIYATDGYGTFAKSNPPLSGDPSLVFGTYGDQIPPRITAQYESDICQPGSSVATAIAAAIAAIMLAYVESLPWVGLAAADEARLEWELERRKERLQNLQKLRTREGMSSLFNRMAPQSIDQRRWICPIWFWMSRRGNAELETALLEVANGLHTPVPVRRFDGTAPL
ncbi:hypothetical protein MAPG_05594 [Magnaporthiopsis poae ATCC 64411]|uniref:Uncharacterized protein n=1 Tax=Magnaporthiopsis poae (strain ATCC 64411 / 73-15) TaxID=644358 RepID=A0A0C4DZT7_MAGP6|nr:hypothetical protein MAPG_05594 [Magnaporthiopsis poae ATCC 64411]